MIAEYDNMLTVESVPEDHLLRDLEVDIHIISRSNFIGAFQDALGISPDPYLSEFDLEEDSVEDPKGDPDENLIKRD